jgi:glycosyltransferase involved in cell wall biosynthesis
MGKKLSIVTTIYKDSYLAERFVEKIKNLSLPPAVYLHEIIFVIDGSGKKDEEKISELADINTKVKMIALSRNFGQHIAISAGYAATSGDYVCMLNVDQQDPPEEIIVLLKQILKGEHDIVYGIRNKRKDTIMNQLSSSLFNIILNKLTGDNTPLNVATIRIMTRRFIDNYNSLAEKARYLPGLENWLGFPKAYIPTAHQPRLSGKSSYNFEKRLKMAINSIISFSDLPLRWISWLGMIFSVIGFLLLILLIFSKLYWINYQKGYISVISSIIFIGGIQIMMIGLSSIYVGRILREVQNRPLYIVKDQKNL